MAARTKTSRNAIQPTKQPGGTCTMQAVPFELQFLMDVCVQVPACQPGRGQQPGLPRRSLVQPGVV